MTKTNSRTQLIQVFLFLVLIILSGFIYLNRDVDVDPMVGETEEVIEEVISDEQ